MLADVGLDAPVRADIDDVSSLDGKRLLDRVALVGRVDKSTLKHGVGGCVGTCGPDRVRGAQDQRGGQEGTQSGGSSAGHHGTSCVLFLG